MKLSCASRFETLAGRMEVLLTPGVFLRIDESTTVTTQRGSAVTLLKGEALIDRVEKGSAAKVSFLGRTFSITNPSLVEFEIRTAEVRIYEGEVSLENGAAKHVFRNGTAIHVLSSGQLVRARLNESLVDFLYVWSSRESERDAIASFDTARTNNKDGAKSDWFWNNRLGLWAFVPRAGADSSRFGYSFPSPWDASRIPTAVSPDCNCPVAINPRNRPRSLPAVDLTAGVLDLSKFPRFGPPIAPLPGTTGANIPGPL